MPASLKPGDRVRIIDGSDRSGVVTNMGRSTPIKPPWSVWEVLVLVDGADEEIFVRLGQLKREDKDGTLIGPASEKWRRLDATAQE